MHLKQSLIAALLSVGLAGSACASSLVATTDTLGGALAGTVEVTSDATSSLRDMKQLRAARDDAASFVASDGAIRRARLEAALLQIRSHAVELAAADDLTLAQRVACARRTAEQAGDEVGQADAADKVLAEPTADILLVGAAVAEILARMQAFAGGEARSAAEKSINYKAKAPAVFAAGALKSARKPWKIKALRPR